MELATPYGPARVDWDDTDDPAFLLVLTHGSAGGVDAPDLLAVRDAALGLGGAVARVTQPFRLAGRRAPGSAVRQDESWLTVIAVLRERCPGVPLIQCGRSNGARVACRTAAKAGARGVIALAFPLHPPGKTRRSRADELRAAGTEVLVINGDRDPFGIPDPGDATLVYVMPGERHDLDKDTPVVGAVAAQWLRRWSDAPTWPAKEESRDDHGIRVCGGAGKPNY